MLAAALAGIGDQRGVSDDEKPRVVISNPMYKDVAEATVATLLSPVKNVQGNKVNGNDLIYESRRYAGTGNLAVAVSLMERAVAVFSEGGGSWQPETAAASAELARLYNAVGQSELAKEAAARSMLIWKKKRGYKCSRSADYQAALAQASFFKPYKLNVTPLTSWLASQELHAAVRLYMEMEVLKLCRQGREIIKEQKEQEEEGAGLQADTGTLTLFHEMGDAYRYIGNINEALKMARAGHELAERLYGKRHLNTGATLTLTPWPLTLTLALTLTLFATLSKPHSVCHLY